MALLMTILTGLALKVILNLPTLQTALFQGTEISLGITVERPRLTEPSEYLRCLFGATTSSVRV